MVVLILAAITLSIPSLSLFGFELFHQQNPMNDRGRVYARVVYGMAAKNYSHDLMEKYTYMFKQRKTFINCVECFEYTSQFGVEQSIQKIHRSVN